MWAWAESNRQRSALLLQCGYLHLLHLPFLPFRQSLVTRLIELNTNKPDFNRLYAKTEPASRLANCFDLAADTAADIAAAPADKNSAAADTVAAAVVDTAAALVADKG